MGLAKTFAFMMVTVVFIPIALWYGIFRIFNDMNVGKQLVTNFGGSLNATDFATFFTVGYILLIFFVATVKGIISELME